MLAVRTSHGSTKRFWYSVPVVIAASAITHSEKFVAVTSPAPSLRQTTSSNPARPRARPSHCRGATRCARPCTALTQMAVSTGCRPTTSADVPAPMPACTAAQMPPRYIACISTPVTARCSHCRRPRGHGARTSTIQIAKAAIDSP